MQRNGTVSLVTGGAGFIGSHLAAALAEAGEKVRVLDDFSTGRRENLPKNGKVEVIEGDVRNPADVQRAVDGAGVVYHLAALVSVPHSMEDPAATNSVNVGGTYTVLAAAARAKARRFVFASSSSVYGDSGPLPRTEDQAVNPLSPYAASKASAETACRSFSASVGLETACLRFFNVYGPRQDPASPYAAVVPIFLSRLLRREPLTIHGDGAQTRDFTFVSDVVRGIRAAAGTKGATGAVLNLAGGRGVTIKDLALAAGRVVGVEPKIEFGPARPGDVLHSYGDGARAAQTLGFRPEVAIEEGLRRTADWLRT